MTFLARRSFSKVLAVEQHMESMNVNQTAGFQKESYQTNFLLIVKTQT